MRQPCQTGSAGPRRSRVAGGNGVDGDRTPERDDLTRKGKGALQERWDFGQIAVIGKQARKRFRRPDDQ